MRKFARLKMLGAGVALSVMLAGCASAGDSGPGESGGGEGGESGGDVEAAQAIDGAGATFPAPLYNEMFQAFAEDGGIQVNYQSVGSGSGIEQYISGTVDFGASDAPMTEEELGQVEEETLHIATVGGAVAPTYNLPGVDELNLTGPVLADIFLGNITEWDDPAIADLNPDAELPSAPIQVVHRSDGSGTTSIWVEYLAAVSEQWADEVGAATDVSWPVGSGGDGNEGVAAQVQQTENAIGYNELAYAVENDIPTARVANTPEGPFVEANEESASAVIDGADVPDDLRISLSSLAIEEDAEGNEAFPITGLTWLLVRQEQEDLAVCKAVAEAAWFATHEGQEFASPNYVPIAGETLEISEEFIQSMEAQGEPCYEGGEG